MSRILTLTMIFLCFYKSLQFNVHKKTDYKTLEILLEEFDIDNPYIVKNHNVDEAQWAKIRKKVQFKEDTRIILVYAKIIYKTKVVLLPTSILLLVKIVEIVF